MKNFFLITGTSRGIGNAIAKHLLKKKLNVCGVSRSKNNIFHRNFHHIQGDISQIESIEKIFKFFKKKKIKLEGLVNNAGINIPNRFDKISRKDYDKVLEVNIKSPFFLTQKLIPIFNKGASIVNISSFSAISGGPYSSHYAISKSAIETLTKNLSIFFSKKKIRVNAISPGLIRTGLAKNFKKHPYFDRILLNRIGETKEIAEVVDFLLSEKSSYVNGQILNVDGGMFFK